MPFAAVMVVKAKEIMHTDVLVLPFDIDALSGARQMVAARKGYAVVERDSSLAGIVTEWDYLEKIVARQIDPARASLGSIATREVVSCSPETSTLDVVETMATQGIRRMVVREGPRVVGVITSKEVIGIFRSYVDKISSDISRLQDSLL